MAKLRLSENELRNAMTVALCCVVPFLCEYVTNATEPFIPCEYLNVQP
jgi:hypothetical protein